MARNRIGPRLVDVRPDRVDLRDRVYMPPLVSLPGEYPDVSQIKQLLPLYRKDGMILDQGNEGACTGFGLAAVVNYLLWRRGLHADRRGLIVSTRVARVSPRMLYHLARIYDEWPGEDYEGSSCRGAMKGWHRHGACTETLWPYWVDGKNRFTPPAAGWVEDAANRPLGAYYRIDKDSVADVQAAIHEVGAVYVSAGVHAGWNLGTSDSLPVIPFKRQNQGGHSFALVGYTRDGFIVQNSWNETWGYAGFAVMSYEDWVKNGMDAWVAVLGAPVALTQTEVARTSASLRDVATDKASLLWRSGSTEDDTSESAPQVAPWSEARAYQFTVVMGNDGQPLNRLLEYEKAVESLRAVAYDKPRAWLDGSGTTRLVVYAHGGLNDEHASVKRIRVMAPYFHANGAYPLFVTWRTGVQESIRGMLEDAVGQLVPGARAAGGLSAALDALRNRLDEAKNRAIELAAGRILAKAIWSQMKQNAAASVMQGMGGALLGAHLAQLQADIPGLEIHLVGHSAGSILHGHLLDVLAQHGAKVDTVTLFAPACTTQFALDHYVPAVDAGVVAKNRIFLEMMTDERERADTVGPYGKSLLYLVSRALEIVHKTPLLGMQAAWTTNPGSFHWEDAVKPAIRKWKQFAGTAVRVRELDRTPVRDGPDSTIPLAHGSFDNDVEVMERTIRRVTKSAKLAWPVQDLRSY